MGSGLSTRKVDLPPRGGSYGGETAVVAQAPLPDSPVRRPMRQGKACRWAFSPVPPQARVKFPVGVLRSRQREMAPSQPSGFAPDAGPTVQRFDAHHARKISGWDEARSPKGVATAIILADGNSRPPGQHTANLRYQAAGEEMAPRSSPVGRIRGLRYALLVVGVAPCTGVGCAAVGLARRRRLAVKGERHARTDTANGAEA
jgi:hypothetical protein